MVAKPYITLLCAENRIGDELPVIRPELQEQRLAIAELLRVPSHN
jgi:hypothetical protein